MDKILKNVSRGLLMGIALFFVATPVLADDLEFAEQYINLFASGMDDSCQVIDVAGVDDISKLEIGFYCSAPTNTYFKIREECGGTILASTNFSVNTGTSTWDGIDLDVTSYSSVAVCFTNTGSSCVMRGSYLNPYSGGSIFAESTCSESANNDAQFVAFTNFTPEPPTYCGDGDIDEPNDYGQFEECDDGNTDPHDGCDQYCKIEIMIDLAPCEIPENYLLQRFTACRNVYEFSTTTPDRVEYFYYDMPLILVGFVYALLILLLRLIYVYIYKHKNLRKKKW